MKTKIECGVPLSTEEIKELVDLGRVHTQILDHIQRVFKRVANSSIDNRIKVSSILEEMEDELNRLAPGTRWGNKGYCGFPAIACFSKNDVALHGIPNVDDYISAGDIVTIDFSLVSPGGVWTDACRTYWINALCYHNALLVETACNIIDYIEDKLKRALTKRGYITSLDIVKAATKYVNKATKVDKYFHILPGYGGHTVGRRMHGAPYLGYHEFEVEDVWVLRDLVSFTVEPVVVSGPDNVFPAYVNDDLWSIGVPGRYSAQYERQYLIYGDQLVTIAR